MLSIFSPQTTVVKTIAEDCLLECRGLRARVLPSSSTGRVVSIDALLCATFSVIRMHREQSLYSLLGKRGVRDAIPFKKSIITRTLLHR